MIIKRAHFPVIFITLFLSALCLLQGGLLLGANSGKQEMCETVCDAKEPTISAKVDDDGECICCIQLSAGTQECDEAVW